MTKTIEVRDAGPVERLTIPIPEDGGCVVLRGQNGSGKSHALSAASALFGAKQKPVSRDGSAGVMVEGLGARLTVGRRATRSGELEVSHMEGEDPSLLVDPRLKSQEAADAARIRALLRLSGAKVDIEAFGGLLEGGAERLRELCRPATLDLGDDVPGMAAAVKRDLEAAARRVEGEAENLFAKAEGVKQTLGGLDDGAELSTDSSDAARAAHASAIRQQSALLERQQQADRLRRAADQAKAALEGLGDEGTAEAIDAAQKVVVDVGAKITDVEARKAELRRELAELDARSGTLLLAQRHARADLEHQRSAADQRERLTKAVEAASEAAPVDDATLAAANEAVAETSAELDAWAVRDKTAGLRDRMAELNGQAAEASGKAAALREAASGTERVVLEAVSSVCGDDFELQDGRLYVHTEDRGKELFAELSPGERWRRALDIAVRAVGREGLLVICQEAWDAMDGRNRAEVDRYARELGVVVLTATHDTQEGVRAEVFAEASK